MSRGRATAPHICRRGSDRPRAIYHPILDLAGYSSVVGTHGAQNADACSDIILARLDHGCWQGLQALPRGPDAGIASGFARSQITGCRDADRRTCRRVCAHTTCQWLRTLKPCLLYGRYITQPSLSPYSLPFDCVRRLGTSRVTNCRVGA
ncbi:hypothetical protein BD309DRAFT_478553 [Dichomitus squalens]|nr:hypothetical protein BD309DRAFT_478553 [Dichomitus squalens]